MSATVSEPSRVLPVSGAYDVVVVGGGIAGIAAALAAARSGVSVALLERYCALGGLATLGNVITYLPLCDGNGRQVLSGIAEELLKRSIAQTKTRAPAAHFDTFPAMWLPDGDAEARKKHRYQADFNPDAAILDFEEVLVREGVEIFYDTRFSAVLRDGARITHVLIENKDGRTALACGAVVDASGDADVCFAAGEKTESLDSNVLCGWYYTLRDGADFRLRYLSRRFTEDASRDGAEGPFFRGDRARDVTRQILGSRDLLRESLAKLRAAEPDADIQPMHIPTYPTFRMTRRLVGAHSVTRADDHRWFDDAVCLANDWRRRGPVWAVPLSALAGVANENLAACGRCMSVDTTAWDALRVIPVCGATGEAAGVAAALGVKTNRGNLRDLSPAGVASELRARGNLLDKTLVETAPSAN